MNDGAGSLSSPDLSCLAPALTEPPETMLQRPAAAGFLRLWDTSASAPDVFAFLRNHPEFTARDCTDVCILDQLYRWHRGVGLPAEAYCRQIRSRTGNAVPELEWEVVACEYVIRKSQGIDPQAGRITISELCHRFPDFQEQLSRAFDDPTDAGSESTPELEATRYFVEADVATDIVEPSVSATLVLNNPDAEQTLLDWDEDDFSNVAGFDPGPHDPASVLGKTPPFVKLPPGLVRLIEKNMEARSYERGEHLIRQGDVGNGLFVLTSGQVEISVVDNQKQSHVIAAAGSGEIIGEMALITEEPRTASVIASGPVTAHFLPIAVFDDLAAKYPIISRVLTQLLADRLGRRGHDALAGKTLGEYRINRRLGRGGMAIVYQAESLKTGRLVALKMMNHRLVYDANALRLFQREASMIEQFEHPGIIRMYGRFRAFRSYFIVLEYCQGTTLDDIIQREGRLDEGRFRTVMSQLAAALSYAHERQIVHRDLKPSNVMLTSNNSVKLMDFGLANPIDNDTEQKRGIVAGTPKYMAPEQLIGDAIDTRADYFALGCTAYKLLTGTDLIPETTIALIQKRHARWTPPKLSGVSAEVAEFVEQCLQFRPHDRNVDLDAVARW